MRTPLTAYADWTHQFPTAGNRSAERSPWRCPHMRTGLVKASS